MNVLRGGVMVVVLITVPAFALPAHDNLRRVLILVALAVSAVGVTGWLLAGDGNRTMAASLAVAGLGGGALAGMTPLSMAMAVGMMACAGAANRLVTEVSVAITASTVAMFLICGISTGQPGEALLGLPFAFIGLWAMGQTRRGFLERAEQAEQMLDQSRRARDAETEAAALAERARIAREIHDVLAHSLAAVSVNLQAAEGLLSGLPESPELTKAVGCVERAGAFAREGLADARRAILALRDDAPPLADHLASLAEQYRADGGTVEFTVTGTPRQVTAEAGLAAYRTAQEALTNARKHAPGQPVHLGIEFTADEISVSVANPLASTEGPLARTGAGYGLTGLRERAALGGGTLTAGPADGYWRVWLRIPA
jgi:signal transduction histidine kinase